VFAQTNMDVISLGAATVNHFDAETADYVAAKAGALMKRLGIT